MNGYVFSLIYYVFEHMCLLCICKVIIYVIVIQIWFDFICRKMCVGVWKVTWILLYFHMYLNNIYCSLMNKKTVWCGNIVSKRHILKNKIMFQFSLILNFGIYECDFFIKNNFKTIFFNDVLGLMSLHVETIFNYFLSASFTEPCEHDIHKIVIKS